MLLVAVLLVAGCSTMQTVPAAEAPAVNGEVGSAEPVSITIPKLGITDEVVPVGDAADGSMEIPKVTETGWYRRGPRPGEPGLALISGHVDFAGVPGAFKHLGGLGPGDTITVKDATGIEHVFTVYDTQQIAKKDYAAKTARLLFSTTNYVELGLVTCSGTVSNHQYSDNTVVRARLLA